jgi:hypothetical protein
MKEEVACRVLGKVLKARPQPFLLLRPKECY